MAKNPERVIGKVSPALEDLRQGALWQDVVDKYGLSKQSRRRLRNRLRSAGEVETLERTYAPKSINLEIAARLREALDTEEIERLSSMLADRFCIRSSSGDDPLFIPLGRLTRFTGRRYPHSEKAELAEGLREAGIPVRLVEHWATYPSGQRVLQRYYLIPSMVAEEAIRFLES